MLRSPGWRTLLLVLDAWFFVLWPVVFWPVALFLDLRLLGTGAGLGLANASRSDDDTGHEHCDQEGRSNKGSVLECHLAGRSQVDVLRVIVRAPTPVALRHSAYKTYPWYESGERFPLRESAREHEPDESVSGEPQDDKLSRSRWSWSAGFFPGSSISSETGKIDPCRVVDLALPLDRLAES